MAKNVVFIHGLWIHSTAWKPWQDLFESKGYTTTAPGWPGDLDTVEATRANPSGLDNQGIAEICHHYADIIESFDEKPIVVGHSFGGLIAQELLALDLVAAAVAIHTAVRGPLLLTSGTEDHTVPKAVTVAVAKLYADNTSSVTEYHEYEGKGHSLTMDAGWREVADDVLTWLAGKGF